MPVELSYCVVNTEHRQLLSYCLDAIARERATVDFETETLVLDNASGDGSAETARAHAVTTEVIICDERRGRGENASELIERARGRFCLILNEDSELEPGATAALHSALAGCEEAAAAGATLVRVNVRAPEVPRADGRHVGLPLGARDALAAMDEVDYVVITAGSYDLLVEVVAESDAHLLELISGRIRAIEGVVGTETFMYLRLLKQTYSWGVR